jgi:hypothetical protein
METIKIKNYSELPEGFTGIVEYTSGTKGWYLNGKRHRTDGSAIEYPDGTKEWWLNGQYHREDGPAIEEADGSKEWFLNGNFIYALEPLGDYILIEDGLPSEFEWLGEQVTQRKVLTEKGFMYIPNLPGI